MLLKIHRHVDTIWKDRKGIHVLLMDNQNSNLRVLKCDEFCLNCRKQSIVVFDNKKMDLENEIEKDVKDLQQKFKSINLLNSDGSLINFILRGTNSHRQK